MTCNSSKETPIGYKEVRFITFHVSNSPAPVKCIHCAMRQKLEAKIMKFIYGSLLLIAEKISFIYIKTLDIIFLKKGFS